jgi:glutamine amidotransferase
VNVVIIKYNAGNIKSVDYALQRLGLKPEITNDHEKIMSADKVIFPGVGEASTTMQYLKKNNIDKLIKGLRQPLLGICLGMHMLCKHSEENDTPCIGVFDETVKKFAPGAGMENITKVPQMGWNSIYELKEDLFDTAMEGSYVYFVHSYYVTKGENTAATCDYIMPFSAALNRGNYYATQFHPEKSGKTGAKILENFIRL